MDPLLLQDRYFSVLMAFKDWAHYNHPLPEEGYGIYINRGVTIHFESNVNPANTEIIG